MFCSDRPIISDSEDRLNRSSFANLLAQTLVNLDTEDTFTIGLFGSWGCGKTSLVNLTLSELQKIQDMDNTKRKTIVVHFEPWNFTDSNQLLSQFFVRMANEFRKSKDDKLNKAGKALENYSDAFGLLELIPAVGGALATVGKLGASFLGKKMQKGLNERDISAQKEAVVKLLKEQDNRILVVIDDIDRLSNDQIRYVFQLITSVAKFPNTTYLLVFDKNIIVQALKDVQSGNGEDYLEKIIQMPIQIPDIPSANLRNILSAELESIREIFPKTGFSQEHWQRLFEPCVAPFIKNIRDINRICNTLRFKLREISDEVDFVDMVAISALEIHHPAIYEWVKNSRTTFTGAFDATTLFNRDISEEEYKKKYSETIEALIETERQSSDIETAVKELFDFLTHLFPYFGQKINLTYEVYDANKSARFNLISHPDKFERYFSLNVDDIAYRTSDINAFTHQMSEKQIVEYLLQLESKNSSYDFLKDIKARIPDLSSDRAKILTNALFEAMHHLNAIGNTGLFSASARSLAEHMMLDIMEKISVVERKAFISELIINSNMDTLPDIASVINMLELGYGRLAANGREHGYNKILTLDELEEIEKVFTQRAKGLLEANSLFEFSEWRIIHHLLASFDPEFTNDYISKCLLSDTNVLHFMSSFIGGWIGAGVEYEIQKGYEEFFSSEKVIASIESCIKSQIFFTLPIEVQRKSAAFYLKTSGKTNYRGYISQPDADALIDEWKTKVQN